MLVFQMKKLFIPLLLIAGQATAQTGYISLDTCYQLARQNYPLIKKYNLINEAAAYSVDNASKRYLPQLTVSGQASYQSQTISFPKLPQFAFPTISKDQYRMQAELTQLIYDGGDIGNQKAILRANEQVQQQSVEVTLQTVKERVTQVYFSILLIEKQLEQNATRKSDLQSALAKANAALENGTGYRSNADELRAALIDVDMAATNLAAARKGYRDMLALLIGRPLNDSTHFTLPAPPAAITGINRPELKYYDLRKKTMDIQEKQLKSDYTPRISAFVQGAYGRPTLNIIDNQFGAWWLGGLRLNWSLGSLYTLKNNRELLQINRKDIDADRETFVFNTSLALSQQEADLKKYTELLLQDDTLIALRNAVVQSSKAQLDNGVITVHEYITRLNDENLARQQAILHRIQWLLAQYNYKNSSGN